MMLDAAIFAILLASAVALLAVTVEVVRDRLGELGGTIEHGMIAIGAPALDGCRALTGRPREPFHPGPSRLRMQREAMAEWEDRFATATDDPRRFAVDPDAWRVYVVIDPAKATRCRDRYPVNHGSALTAAIGYSLCMGGLDYAD